MSVNQKIGCYVEQPGRSGPPLTFFPSDTCWRYHDFTSQFEKNNESREHKFIDRKISSCCLYATGEKYLRATKKGKEDKNNEEKG